MKDDDAVEKEGTERRADADRIRRNERAAGAPSAGCDREDRGEEREEDPVGSRRGREDGGGSAEDERGGLDFVFRPGRRGERAEREVREEDDRERVESVLEPRHAPDDERRMICVSKKRRTVCSDDRGPDRHAADDREEGSTQYVAATRAPPTSFSAPGSERAPARARTARRKTQSASAHPSTGGAPACATGPRPRAMFVAYATEIPASSMSHAAYALAWSANIPSPSPHTAATVEQRQRARAGELRACMDRCHRIARLGGVHYGARAAGVLVAPGESLLISLAASR